MSAFLNWLRASGDALRTSLWLIPGIMFLLGILLALAMLQLERGWSIGDPALAAWIGAGNGEDARNLLSTLLTAIISMASMAFSVTVVALTLAANNYGPRMIRIFRANRRNQVVLGIFMMSIVYLLLVLRSVHGDTDPAQVPQAAVATGSFLALASVVALLAFIQGVATSMAADEVLRRVRKELDGTISQLPDLAEPDRVADEPLADGFEADAARIPLPGEGYVQSVQFEEIAAWAERNGTVVQLDFRPGDFVVAGDRKVLLNPCPDDLEQARRQIDRFIVSGQERTPNQDLEFAIRHLVEVAVRALSPGINDPFTAIAALDRLRGGLSRLCGKQLPPETLRDASGAVRLRRRVTTYAGVLNAAFNQIRQAGSDKPAILIHMLHTIAGIAQHRRNDQQRAALAHHAELVRDAGLREVADPSDRQDVQRAFNHAMQALAVAARSGAEPHP
jgi:uncharacterized membrane protein